MWRLLLIALAWSLLMPAGDCAMYREAGGGTTATASGVALTLDTIDDQETATFELSGGAGGSEVLVKEACRVLYFGGAELEQTTAGGELGLLRLEKDPNTGTFGAEVGGWDMEYLSNANSVDRVPLGVAGIVDCVANSKLRLWAESGTNDLAEVANRTFLHLFRLPASAEVGITVRNSNQTGIATTLTDIAFNSNPVLDANWTKPTNAELKWNGGSVRALVMACVTFSLPATFNDRTSVHIRLLKNGTAVNFTGSDNFIRGSGNNTFCTCHIALPVDLTTNDLLKVQAQITVRANVSTTVRIHQNRTALMAVVIHDNVDWIRIRHASDQGADNASLTDFACDTEDEEDGSFSHSTSSNTGEITLNRNHRYALGYQITVDRTTSSTADDINWDVAWRKNNTTDLDTRGSGSFTDGAVSSVDFKDGTLTGGIIYRASPGDILELRIKKIGSGADSAGVFKGGSAVNASLVWAMDLDDMRAFGCRTTFGAVEKGKALIKHLGNGKDVQGALERSKAIAAHGARSSETHGTTDKAKSLAAHGARGADTLGSVESAKSLVAHGGRGLETHGSVERAQSVSAHAARATDAFGEVERATPAVAHSARAADTLGATERAAALGVHQARAQAGGLSVASAKPTHAAGARSSIILGLLAQAKALVTSVGGSIIYGKAMAIFGSIERAVATSMHAGRGAIQPGAVESSKATAMHLARASDVASSLESAQGVAAHKARGADASGSLERGQAAAAHRASGGDAMGEASIGRAASAHAARAAEASVEVSSARPIAAHGGRGSIAAGEVERAQSAAAHAARAKSTDGVVERSTPTVKAGPQARDAFGAIEGARATAAHGASARISAGFLELAKAFTTSANVIYGRAMAVFGFVERASGMTTHAARGRVVFGSADPAVATVKHEGRGVTVAGSLERAQPVAQHAGRARTLAGILERAPGIRVFLARAKALFGVVERGSSTVAHAPQATDVAGAIESASATVQHGGRVADVTMAVLRAQAKAAHAARARTETRTFGNALSAVEVLGFYERTSRTVRTQLISVAGGLQIQHENLRFAEPSGTWARARVEFDEIQDVEYGSGKASYLVPGTLEIELRTKLREGKKTLLEQAEALASALQLREVSNVVYAAASLRPAKDAGDDEFSARLSIPFRSWDASYPRVADTMPNGDDYTDAERAVRSRFAAELPDVAVSYDNLPPNIGATWVRLSVNEQEGFDASGVRRTVGVMEASIHAPALTGVKASLRLADRIVAAFRTVDVGGVVFDIPYVTRGRQVAGEWVTPVFCPWSCDHA